MAVITISRQYGSGGDEIAAQVCERLGYRYFNKQLMSQVATEVGLSPTEIVDFPEDDYQVRSFLERLFGWGRSSRVAHVGTWTENTGGTRVREVLELDETQMISFVQSTIQAAYRHGNVVIVGRGGQAILKNMPGVLHVQIQAPIELQNQRIHELENVSLAEARERAIKHDQAAANYLKHFYNINWLDPHLYDLVINTHKLNIDTAAQLIVTAISYLPQ
jgi:cytidylate kinase